jgi:hypothetical protein
VGSRLLGIEEGSFLFGLKFDVDRHGGPRLQRD